MECLRKNSVSLKKFVIEKIQTSRSCIKKSTKIMIIVSKVNETVKPETKRPNMEGKFRKEIEILRKNQMGILEMKEVGIK